MIQVPFEIINNERHYNFRRCCRYITQLGKQKYGDQFRLYNTDREILYKLMVYAIGDHEECKRHGLELNKGILLNGPIGCGKTSLMTLIRTLQDQPTRYIIKSTRDIASEFNQDGFTVINKYGKQRKIFCFDDLGAENNTKYYGTECNTISEILLYRYDLLKHDGIITHATTNLNADEIEELYGNRVRSRLRSMFNLVAFGKEANDKRR
ncbi:MAG: DNA replication protein DnaC [Crocinitomicaceae bacterium]|jgi:DNA replication protein DnaC